MEFWNRTKMKIDIFSRLVRIMAIFLCTFSSIAFEIYEIFFVENHKFQYRVWHSAVISILLVICLEPVITIGIYFISTNLVLNIKQRYYLFEIQI